MLMPRVFADAMPNFAMPATFVGFAREGSSSSMASELVGRLSAVLDGMGERSRRPREAQACLG